MKLLSWNIQHGGGTRLSHIVEEVSAYDADVIGLTEFRDRPGTTLRAALLEHGWPYVETTDPIGNVNGVAAFSRTPMRRILPCPAPPEGLGRWLDIDLPECGFGLSVLHIMAAGSSKKHPTNVAKTRFWSTVVAAAEARLREPYMFLGDWNTGLHRLDEKGKTFVCADHFAKLSELGWTDLWRRHNTGPTEWTWYSTLKGGARGNGFRLDHAFASPSVTARIRSCRYRTENARRGSRITQ